MKSPTPAAIRAFIKKHGLTGSKAAELAGLSGGNAFRKYTGGGNPHHMSEAIWFTMHARLILSPGMLEEIHQAMEEDATDFISEDPSQPDPNS